MKLVKKRNAPKDDDAVAIAQVPSFPWDHAMKMLATGEYDVVGNPRDEDGSATPTDDVLSAVVDLPDGVVADDDGHDRADPMDDPAPQRL
jgi:hypothetical protein